MMVSPVGVDGEESFDVLICTPRWLAERVQLEGPTVGRHHLLVDSWDFRRIRGFLTDAVESEEGASWTELAERIGRIGTWEFEDYQNETDHVREL